MVEPLDPDCGMRAILVRPESPRTDFVSRLADVRDESNPYLGRLGMAVTLRSKSSFISWAAFR